MNETLTRRQWLTVATAGSTAIAAAGFPALGSAAEQTAPPVRDIGSRRELFIDQFLIERMENTTLRLHEPQLAPPMSEPADHLEYGTVIKDGDLFRLYTRDGRGAKSDGDAPEVTRYCESRDGRPFSDGRVEGILRPARQPTTAQDGTVARVCTRRDIGHGR